MSRIVRFLLTIFRSLVFNFQMGMELRGYKACETNSLNVFLTNVTDAQFDMTL